MTTTASTPEADANYLIKAARDLEEHYKPFGSNVRATVVQILRDAAAAISTSTAAHHQQALPHAAHAPNRDELDGSSTQKEDTR